MKIENLGLTLGIEHLKNKKLFTFNSYGNQSTYRRESLAHVS